VRDDPLTENGNVAVVLFWSGQDMSGAFALTMTLSTVPGLVYEFQADEEVVETVLPILVVDVGVGDTVFGRAGSVCGLELPPVWTNIVEEVPVGQLQGVNDSAIRWLSGRKG